MTSIAIFIDIQFNNSSLNACKKADIEFCDCELLWCTPYPFVCDHSIIRYSHWKCTWKFLSWTKSIWKRQEQTYLHLTEVNCKSLLTFLRKMSFLIINRKNICHRTCGSWTRTSASLIPSHPPFPKRKGTIERLCFHLQ